ncbi:MAG TPA: hypothetical protein VLA31_06980 [Burkholderiaceae bacterium]|nr:hypothetical protein [Burkholderiaceae bacterium]
MNSTCAICGGPVVLREGIAMHTNETGWYAGRQMDHEAVVNLKTITLSFALPDGLDTPSEVLLDLRTLLLDALAEKRAAHNQGRIRMNPDHLALCEALLTES